METNTKQKVIARDVVKVIVQDLEEDLYKTSNHTKNFELLSSFKGEEACVAALEAVWDLHNRLTAKLVDAKIGTDQVNEMLMLKYIRENLPNLYNNASGFNQETLLFDQNVSLYAIRAEMVAIRSLLEGFVAGGAGEGEDNHTPPKAESVPSDLAERLLNQDFGG